MVQIWKWIAVRAEQGSKTNSLLRMKVQNLKKKNCQNDIVFFIVGIRVGPLDHSRKTLPESQVLQLLMEL